jgi:hypothetical protein
MNASHISLSRRSPVIAVQQTATQEATDLSCGPAPAAVCGAGRLGSKGRVIGRTDATQAAAGGGRRGGRHDRAGRRQLPLFRERAPAFVRAVNRVVGSALLSHPRVRLVGVEWPGSYVNTPRPSADPRARGSRHGAVQFREGGRWPPLPRLPNPAASRAAGRMGPLLPGGLEPRLGAAAVPLPPPRRDAAGQRAGRPAHPSPRRSSLAGRPARAVGPTGAPPTRPCLRQLVEPAASRRAADLQEAQQPAGGAVSWSGRQGPQAQPSLGRGAAAEARGRAVPAVAAARGGRSQRHREP